MVNRNSIPLGCGVLCCCLFAATAKAAISVDKGYDLLETTAGTTFAGAPFQGVPLGTFDFGSGPVAVGSADTIVHRLSDLSLPGPGTGTVPIELVALQLVSAMPIDLGAGLNSYFITLQSARGGPASAGQMTITAADPGGGTFNSFFDVFFDIRVGGLNGPIVLSDMLPLSSNGTNWDRSPDPNAVIIDGINHNLNGIDQQADFWPNAITESHPSGAVHSVVEAVVPEPASAIIWSLLGLTFAGATWWQRRKR